MKARNAHPCMARLWPSLIVSASLLVATGAMAQRGGHERSDSGSSRGDSAPRRDSSPPARESAPRRDYSPPARQYSPPARDYAPRRDYSPPARDYTPRRDYSPPARDYTPSYRRDYSPPARDYTPSYRRDNGSAPRRDESSPRSSYYLNQRRDETNPRREDTSPRRDETAPRREDSSPRRDQALPRRDEAAPRRDPGTVRNDTGSRPYERRDPGTVRRDEPGYRRDNQGFRRDNPGGNGYYLDGNNRGRTPELRSGGTRPQYNGGGGLLSISPKRNHELDSFYRTDEGRHFANGISFRPRTYYNNNYFRPYFGGGYAYYPYYAPYYNSAEVFISPYGFYFGIGAPYIYRRHCSYYPPSFVYIDVPIYSGGYCEGYADDRGGDYYLSHNDYDAHDSDLDRAIDDIRDAFRTGDVGRMVDVTDLSVRIAIFERGKYSYSMAPNDYLDITRDALRNMDTVQFDLYRVHRRAMGVYVVSGKHVYRNAEGQNRTVYVSFVLERIGGRYTLTQVGTAPDRIQEP